MSEELNSVEAVDELTRGKAEIRSLIESIWRAEFRKSAPDWKPLTDLSGMVSQMDNMYAGVREQRDQARWDLHNQPTDSDQEKLSGWQPIETAPKDETQILVEVGPGYFAVVSYWCGGWRESANCLLLRDPPLRWMAIPRTRNLGDTQ